ncbi:MAG: molybdenum cofactor guanylyltransferase [Solirubrobacterales bacterium]|nr:molybdenum cofactor guanylyltransferase [Solirubrobacterales bacterium]
MGSPKAALDWYGSTLLRRVTGLVARAVDGPVIVVRAPVQELPELDPAIEVVADAREGRGPVQGLAAGLAAIGDRAPVAYVTSTDVPLLHPAFIRRVLQALSADLDVVLPEIGGHHQPLAAAYRVDLLPVIEELIAAERIKPAFLFERCRVLRLSAEAIRQDPAVARLDPELSSVRNLNDPPAYADAHAVPAPEIRVERLDAVGSRSDSRGHTTVRAWTLGAVAEASGIALEDHVVAVLNGDQVTHSPELPLVAGDVVGFTTFRHSQRPCAPPPASARSNAARGRG